MLSRAAGTPEGLAGQPQIGDRDMPFRARIMASVALATASFLLAPSALAASHPVQVSGAKLKSALLPASSFGPGFHLDLAVSLMLKLVNRVKKLR